MPQRFEDTKEWHQFLHTAQRGEERYGVRLGFEQQNHLIKKIQRGAARTHYCLWRQSRSTTHWLVSLHEVWVVAVYDGSRQTIRTVLPIKALFEDRRYSLRPVPVDILEQLWAEQLSGPARPEPHDVA